MSQPSQLQQPSARYVLPVIEERTSYGFKRLDPYTKLFEERIIFLGQAIDDTVANDIMAQLLTLESMDPDRDISIYVNSPGGSFTALTAIYDTMTFIRPDIQTTCLGQAASAAAVILAAGTPGKRYALANSRILIHQPYTEGGGSFTALTAIYDTMTFIRPDIQTTCLGQAASAAAVILAAGTPGKRYALANSRILIHQPYTEGGGQASDVEIQAREILRMRAMLESMIAKHSGRTEEQVRLDIERDKILTADEALDYGLIDRVLTTRSM